MSTKKKKSKTTTLARQEKGSFLSWLDEHILLILGGFLLAFIPLYPKLPLFDIIPGYIVRVRIEDFLILTSVFIWVLQLFRKKAYWKTPLTKLIIAYAVVGAFSTLSAVLVTQTVPANIWHVGKTLLHYFRYLEYFSLFFILYSAVKSKKDALLVVKISLLTLLGVTIYGIGQRYFYWPVYSTMNREFSKGIRLVLDENARVQSTFGGPYDLGGYLVILLPLLLTSFYASSKTLLKFALGTFFIFTVLLIVINGSRTSFAGFLVASTIITTLFALKKDTWKQSFVWFFKRYSVFLIIVGSISIYYGQSMYERMLQTLQAYPVLHNSYHALNDQRKIFFYEIVPKKLGLNNIDNMGFNIEKPDNAITTAEAEVLVSSDTQPRPASDVPADVYVDVPTYEEVATVSATGEVTTIIVQKERTYSENAKRHGLSLAIRLDTLWPQAINGFLSNPALGSGYATLTKSTVIEFTEAESTDNNFLRTLGETGMLGFLTFYGLVGIVIHKTFSVVLKEKEVTNITFILAATTLAATLGLLLNAVYIDVFAASKVAFTYWGLVGITLAVISPRNYTSVSSKEVKKFFTEKFWS